jgi:hypothetical protein
MHTFTTLALLAAVLVPVSVHAVIKNFSYGAVRPGESLAFGYDYFATASTGFGETGVFAAIGDPFHLDLAGGSFSVQFADTGTPPPSVPEPATLTLMTLGLTSIGLIRGRKIGKRRRREFPCAS